MICRRTIFKKRIMNRARREFFDSRDKYLSFVHATDEKIRIAFYLARELSRMGPPASGRPFYMLDAGTGEGTVMATFLTALHKRMPKTPIVVTGKEISIDDICILLSYLPDRFAEHKTLVVRLTNMTYADLSNPKVTCRHIKKEIRGDTSHDFGLQLMNMADLIKKHWALDVRDGRLIPREKVMLTLYRRDQRDKLGALPPPRSYDFVIAAQPFRLRRAPAEVAKGVVAPLLRLMSDGGRMVLVYASGHDFSRPLLRLLYPEVRPYIYAAPQKLLTALKKLPESTGVRTREDMMHYGFINLYAERREFTLGNIMTLWKAVCYVGQISDAETGATPFNKQVEQKISGHLAGAGDMLFANNVIVFSRRRGKYAIQR